MIGYSGQQGRCQKLVAIKAVSIFSIDKNKIDENKVPASSPSRRYLNNKMTILLRLMPQIDTKSNHIQRL